MYAQNNLGCTALNMLLNYMNYKIFKKKALALQMAFMIATLNQRL